MEMGENKSAEEGGDALQQQQNALQQQQNALQQQQQQNALQQQQQAMVMQQQQLQTSTVQGGVGSGEQSVSSPSTALIVNTANIQQQLQSVGSGGSPLMASSLMSQPQMGNIGQASGSTTITTMSTLPNSSAPQIQQVPDWNASRVQVIQQPMQNTAYVQQVYNAQGQMLMSGNIALHPAPNMNPGSIQVITAGKPFPSNQITSHVLSKPVLAPGGQQATSFPSYATIPTTTNQTLVIGQLVSSQPNILPTHSNAQAKQEMQKGVSGQMKGGCVVSQAPTMLHHLISPIQYTAAQCSRGVGNNNGVQLSPWQFGTQIPQVWTAPHHPQVITAQNPIFIRGPQQEQPMFIQSPPPQPQQQPQQNMGKQEVKAGSPQVSRTLSILPSATAPIRPATTVTTQIIQKQPVLLQNKLRTKAILTKTTVPVQKLDAQNQTKPMSPQLHPSPQQGNKIIITSQGPIIPQQQVTAVQAAEKIAQQVTVQQQQQVQQQIVAQVQQQQVVAQQVQTSQQQVQQVQHAQQVVAQQVQLPPQVQPLQQQQQQQQQPQLQQQLIQPKPPPLLAIGTDISEKTEPVVAEVNQATQEEESVQEEETQDEACGDVKTETEGTTVGAATPMGGTTEEVKGEKGPPPKAMVKPQVLTHVIEGYVIQESSEPFPTYRSLLLSELSNKQTEKPDVVPDQDEPPLKKANIEGEKARCELCGKEDSWTKFKKSKRFCTLSCAKRFSMKNTGGKRGGGGKQAVEEEAVKDKSDNKKDWEQSSVDTNDSVSGGSEAGDQPEAHVPNPLKWTVPEVCEFIKKLPGCCDYAEDFMIQEIDGQALMLLKEDHLMSAMSMKLGPALKICAKIDTMRGSQGADGGGGAQPPPSSAPSSAPPAQQH